MSAIVFVGRRHRSAIARRSLPLRVKLGRKRDVRAESAYRVPTDIVGDQPQLVHSPQDATVGPLAEMDSP